MSSEVDRLKELARMRKGATATAKSSGETGAKKTRGGEVELSPRPAKGSKDKADGSDEKEAKGGQKANSALGAAQTKYYEEIKDGLQTIRKNVAAIEKLRDEDKTVVSDKQRKDIMDQLDKIMSSTSNVANKINQLLNKIKQENDEFASRGENKGSAKAQMRQNMYSTHARKFHSEMNTFNQASNDFKNALKDRTRRQLAIIDRNLPAEQIEEIVDSGRAEEVIQGIITADLDNVVAEIEERHQGIMKLERQVLEIYELFKDLATLVDLQQETFDVIERRLNNAQAFTAQAVEDLKKGEEYQRKSRKRMCCIIAIVIGILVAIIAPIMITVVGKL